ncbi:radical SAM family heme chaperone HemW [Persephonella sp.]|uniref:radical SAM family heme chaperone HemW n=1 Tax=Persephonella sp. TaxID=2060922 RepID=UPI002636900A|nr:radical SAM family heme chaperone HemW [Persephonella sp.]
MFDFLNKDAILDCMIKGIYIHIPFCINKCPYCDFTSVAFVDKDIFRRYLNLLKKEFLLYKDKNFNIQTIYFGGGTPSVFPPEYIEEIIDFIADNVKTVNNLEITIEVNPETYRYKEFKQLLNAGVNRISIGAQSLNEKVLKSLGRWHSPKDVVETVYSAADAGIENINMDMIYGVQGQTLKGLEEDLKGYTQLPVKHISAYMLTAYEETPLGQMVKRGEYSLPEEDLLLDMFKLIDGFLNEKGFDRYELSNWAKKGYHCKHNLFYWTGEEFLGIGVSAWSLVDNERFGNTKNLYEYMEKINKGQSAVLFRDKLSPEEKRKEKIILGLRLAEGIDIELVKDKMDFVNQIVSDGLAKIENNRLKLTPEGIMVSNYITASLI